MKHSALFSALAALLVASPGAAQPPPAKTAPDTAKTAPDTAKIAPDTAKTAPDAVKTAPDTAKTAPKAAKPTAAKPAPPKKAAATKKTAAAKPALKKSAAPAKMDPHFPAAYRARYAGKERQLRLGELAGQPILVHLWASWCPPCFEEMPDLIELERRYGAQGLKILSISIDEDLEAFEDALDEHEIPGVILHDPENNAGLTFGFDSLPSSFLYDRRGRLVFATERPVDLENLHMHTAIQSALRPLSAPAK